MKKDTVTKYFLLGIVLLAIVFAIAMKATIFQKEPTPPPAPAVAESQAFRDYWFGGKAEINSYQLQQAQYGSLMPGKAVLIFVTEDFRTDTQVKSESEATRDRSAPTLKSNIIRKFVTGIYDYSLFTSVFTPINNPVFPRTLKVSTSAQEWCGHSYIQLNLRSTGYAVSGRSYFEKEVAEDYTVAKVMLGRRTLEPHSPGTRQTPDRFGTTHSRHTGCPPPASAPLTRKPPKSPSRRIRALPLKGTPCKHTTLIINQISGSCRSFSRTSSTYRIVGWEETYATKNKVLTSRAVLQQTIQSDYWNRNQPADSTLRRSLAIP